MSTNHGKTNLHEVTCIFCVSGTIYSQITGPYNFMGYYAILFYRPHFSSPLMFGIGPCLLAKLSVMLHPCVMQCLTTVFCVYPHQLSNQVYCIRQGITKKSPCQP